MTRKIVSLLLCVFLLAGIFPTFAFAAGERYIVTAERTNVLDKASLFGKAKAELQKGDYISILETNGDFGYVNVNSTGISGWIFLPHLNYAGAPADAGNITGISILKKPSKLTYTDGEEAFDPSGMLVTAKKKDGTEAAVSGYKIFAPSMSGCKKAAENITQTVYVVYRPEGFSASYSASFDITIRPVPLTSLSIVSMPAKDVSSYIENQPLDLKGLKLKAAYSDGRADKFFTADEILKNTDFIIAGCHSETDGKKLVKGTHNIQIVYKYPEISCGFTVTAKAKTLTAFEVTTPPDKTTVYKKTMPDLTGLTLTAEYDNGEVINVAPEKCRITCDPSKFILGKGNKMTLTYEDKSVTLDFTYALLEKTGLRLRLPQKLTFILGEPIDLSAFEVYYVYSSGDAEKTTDYTRGEIDPMKTGAQTIPVSAGIFTTTFTIYINPWYQKGDIDGDGKISAADARLALRAAVGLVTLSGNTLYAGDVDNNGKMSAADARLILRAAVGLEDFLKDIRNTKI